MKPFKPKYEIFEAVKASGKVPHGVLTLIMATLFLVLGILGGNFIVGILLNGVMSSIIDSGLLSANSDLANSLFKMKSLISNYIGVAILIFIWVQKVEKRKLSTMGFTKVGAVKDYGIGFFIGLLLFSVVVVLLLILNQARVDQSLNLAFLAGALVIIPGWIIQGGTEEILTRGWFMPVLGARHGAVVGVIGSSVYFAVLHLLNAHVSAIALINICLVGVFAALYILRTGQIWGVCGFHSAWNWIQGSVFGFQVSGSDIGTPTIIKMSTIGNPVLSGGEFGPEASLVVSGVLLISVLLIVFWPKKNEANQVESNQIQANEI